MMVCNHEEIAVQIAHGYAKATGKPMIAIVHNLVGLLHCNLAIYYAFIDRVPIFIMGATGPMDEAKRRPHIDWTHTALVQGNAVRDYTKWDYQPTSVHGVPESFARAYSIMMTEPKGPIYMCYDAALQESPLTEEVPLPPPNAARVPAPMMPDPEALQRDRRQAPEVREPAADGRVRRPARGRLREHGGAGRDDRRAGVGHRQRAQLPQQASAQRQPRQVDLQGPRPDRRPRHEGLREVDARAQQRAAPAAAAAAGRAAISSRSVSPRSASRSGRWTTAACSRARCARSATRRSPFPR